MTSIIPQILRDFRGLTEEQKIAIAVYMATLDVMNDAQAKLDAYAQRLRDVADAGEYKCG